MRAFLALNLTDEVVEHLENFNPVNPDAGYKLRKFDERFDEYVEDFTGATVNGEFPGKIHNGFLRAMVDSKLDNFPDSVDGALYKCASGNYEAMNLGANGIGFRIRVAAGKIGLKNLRLELRGDDARTYGRISRYHRQSRSNHR